MTDNHETKEGLFCECHCAEHAAAKEKPVAERTVAKTKSAEDQEKERRKVANTGVEDVAAPEPPPDEPE